MNQNCFYYHIINLSCLIFIKSMVYFEKKSYSDNANFKIVLFSFAGKSSHLEWNSPLISLSLERSGCDKTKKH